MDPEDLPDKPDETEWTRHWFAMASSCGRIRDYTAGMDYETFRNDDRTYDAVVRNLEVVGHAAVSLPHFVSTRLGEALWRKAAGFTEAGPSSIDREDDEALWRMATETAPALLEKLEELDVDALRAQTRERKDLTGRYARWPLEIPWRGWRDIAIHLWSRLIDHNVFIVAGGVAFFGLVALFPALAALVSAYGLLFESVQVQEHLDNLAALLPSEAWGVIKEQLSRIARNPDATLSIGAIVGAIITLWSARAGVGALMVAMNIVYGEQEKRGLIAWYALSLLLTIAAIIYAVVALSLIVAVPAFLGMLGIPGGNWVSMLRWPLLAVATMLGLSIIYRYGPSRRLARWPWVTFGAIVATLLWLLGSALFSFYIASFGNYDEIYGSVGAVIILMLWFYVTGLIVLLGAELDAVTERQTRIDSTTGPPRPMGERGAYVADTLNPPPK